MVGWRPGIYRVFVYSLIARPSEYQAGAFEVREDGTIRGGLLRPEVDE